MAVDLLADHPGNVAVITIDIGGNDVLACLDPTTQLFDQGCLDQAFPATLADLGIVLTTLQEAAPGVPIVGMNYSDAFLGLWVLGPDARAVAVHNGAIVADLNAQLTATYPAAKMRVADVAGAFDSDNFTDSVAHEEVGRDPGQRRQRLPRDVVLRRQVRLRRPRQHRRLRRHRRHVPRRHPAMNLWSLFLVGAVTSAFVAGETHRTAPGPPTLSRCTDMHLEVGHVPGRLTPTWELLCDSPDLAPGSSATTR